MNKVKKLLTSVLEELFELIMDGLPSLVVIVIGVILLIVFLGFL